MGHRPALRRLLGVAVGLPLVLVSTPVLAASHGPDLRVSLRTASMTVRPHSVVTFDPTRTAAPAGDSIVSWRLSWDDGSRSASGQGRPRRTLQHAFRTTGRRHVTLTVTDAHRRSASKRLTLTVAAPPAAAPVASPPVIAPSPSRPASPRPTTKASASPSQVAPSTRVPSPSASAQPILSSSPSPTAGTMPQEPTGLVAQVAGQSVSLTWTAQAPYGVEIVRSTGASAPEHPSDGDLIATTAPGSVSARDLSVDAGTSYSYSVFTRAGDGTDLPAPAVAHATVTATSAPVHECGPIVVDTTWGPSSAGGYIFDCPVTVAPRATLTVQAGTWIKGTKGTTDPACQGYGPYWTTPTYCYGGAQVGSASLVVEGTLEASGTADSPITFTSPRDDSVGGDTDSDGATSPAATDQAPIVVNPLEGWPVPVLHLDHTTYRYGSGISGTGLVDVTITSSSVLHTLIALSFSLLDGSGITVTGDTIDDTRAAGVWAGVAPAPYGRPSTTTPVISGNAVSRAQEAVVVSAWALDASRLTGNTAGQVRLPALVIAGALSADATVPATGLPWVVGACSIYSPIGGYTTTCGLSVPAGTTLTVGAGAVLKVDTNATLAVGGSLVGTGTSNQPATITSLRDDTVGGDTNGDGNGSGPAAGDWGGITASNPDGEQPVLSLDHTTVGFAGVSASGPSAVSITSSTVHDATGVGILVSQPVTGTTRITGTTVDGAVDGIDVSTATAGGTPPTVSGNTVTRATLAAIHVNGGNLDGSLLTGNTGSHDREAALVLTGILTHDSSTPTTGLPWVIGTSQYGCYYPYSYPYYYTYNGTCGSLVVASGVTLTVPAGSVVKMDNAELVVQGTLVGAGTSSSRATVTSLPDDSLGGDTNGDGNGSVPVANGWGGIWVQPVSGQPRPSLDLAWTTLSYAQSGVISQGLVDLTVTHSTIQHNQVSGISVTAATGSQVDLESNTIAGGSGTGISVGYDSDDLTDAPTISGDAVNGFGGYAIWVRGEALAPALLAGNTGSANGINAVAASGKITSDLSLPATGLPWVVVGATDGYALINDAQWGLTVGVGATLSMGPGAVLKLDRGYVTVRGTLSAHGSAANPAVITGIADDSVGGDTNGDGNGSIPSTTPWGSLQTLHFAGDPVPTVTLDHATVRYAYTAVQSISNPAAAHIAISASTFTDDWGITDVHLDAGSSFSLTGSTISHDRSGVSVAFGATATAVAPTIMGNTFSQVPTGDVIVSSPDLQPALLTGNTDLTRSSASLSASGILTADLSLPVPGLSWVVANPGLVVGPGVSLTLGGTEVLKAWDSATLTVQGTLRTSPGAVLTSWEDDTGGDTNGDGNGSVPGPYSWRGVVADRAPTWPAPTIALDGATVEWAFAALTTAFPATITHARVTDDYHGVVGPAAADDGTCSATVAATDTYWGSATGPAPAGHGSDVSGCVTTTPFSPT